MPAETGFLSSKKYRDFSRDKGTKTVCEWREHFAELTNNHLALAGHDVRVDHRSYKDQGLELEATQHEGPEVTQLRRQGIETEISLKNNSIKARNHELKEIEKVLSGLDQEIFASENLQSKLQAALEAKQLEKQRLEAEQDQIQRDIAKFYDLQSKYINFANQSFDLQREKEKAIEPIIKRRNKIEKITLKYADADATISREYSAMQNKYGEIPDFWISKQDAQKQVKKIEANYAEQLQNLSKEIGFLTLATELTQIYRSLKSQKIDLEIPRQKKIFGIAVSPVIPPSAETLAADLEAHFFQPLGYDFETSFKQAIKTSEQKRKDAEKQRKEKIEQETRLQQENSLRLEREARIAEHEAEIRRMQKACGYRPNCEYAAVDPHINLLTRLIASNILKKQDVSAYIAEKAIRIEGELEKVFTLSEANKIYPEYLQMLEADKQLLKQNSDKNFEKISALYELVSKKYSEKIEKEQMFMEKSLKTSPPVPQNRITSNKNLDSNNSNDLSM